MLPLHMKALASGHELCLTKMGELRMELIKERVTGYDQNRYGSVLDTVSQYHLYVDTELLTIL